MTGVPLSGRAVAASPSSPAVSTVTASIPDATVAAAAKAICRSGKFETGQGTCALLCMEFLGDPRKGGCSHALKIHGALARSVLEAAIGPLAVAGKQAVETLAASRHLIGKYTPDHHWLPEHDQRIAELREAFAATQTQGDKN